MSTTEKIEELRAESLKFPPNIRRKVNISLSEIEQSIADELNAARSDDDYRQAAEYWKRMFEEQLAESVGGECEFIIEDNMNETEGMGDVWFRCTNCGTTYDYYADDWLMKQNFCPHCGFKIRKAVER